MSDSKFTPGPYLVIREPCWYGLEARFFTVTNGDGLILALCKDWMDGPEPESNARLFAAAPDLLAALKVARDDFLAIGKTVPGDYILKAIASADAAIQKASE
jgi:hypothetical protein